MHAEIKVIDLPFVRQYPLRCYIHRRLSSLAVYEHMCKLKVIMMTAASRASEAGRIPTIVPVTTAPFFISIVTVSFVSFIKKRTSFMFSRGGNYGTGPVSSNFFFQPKPFPFFFLLEASWKGNLSLAVGAWQEVCGGAWNY